MKFEYTYKKLPEHLFSASRAEDFSQPSLIKFNSDLSEELSLNLSEKSSEELSLIFSAQSLPEGCHPISLAYAGHQFGHFVPELGDGRAMLLGEVVNSQGKRFDLQLKGSGRTKFSRNGDGRSALGPVLREYLVSEAMFHLGVPTTRSLAAILTGDEVYRDSITPGGILTRVASSHIRIGTFQYLAYRGDQSSLKSLLDYCVERHYPNLLGKKDLALNFFKQVSFAQIKLISHWMSLGFIHGVMNTDNMTISGETIDYGPCAFMDQFNFQQVYSYIDRNGRYAYGNQPKILVWNMARLAECLIPLMENKKEEAIEVFNHELSLLPQVFEKEFNSRMAKKFGLLDEVQSGEILQVWFEYLESEQLDFTLSFRKLTDIFMESENNYFPPTELFKKFCHLWKAKLKDSKNLKEKLDATNPLFIPRNHLIERVIQKANLGDYSLFHEFHEILRKPFNNQEDFLSYSLPPRQEEKIKNTFCGT